MSQRNTRIAKSMRRYERTARKELAAKRITFHGVMTTQKIVLGQRYLALAGLPFSASIAAVRIVSATEE